MNEKQLEKLCLDWFRENRWDIAYGPDIAPDSYKPERSDYHQVVLKRYLHEALVRINPHLPESAIEQAMAIILKHDSLDLNTNNHALHRLLLEGVPVEYRKDDRTIHDRAFLIDFELVLKQAKVLSNAWTH